MTPLQLQGIGMTSQRTRDRLINRLLEQGIKNKDVLESWPTPHVICSSMKP